MTILVFGNPDLPDDALPLKILPELKKRFPKIEFKIQDPNEEWDIPEELAVVDTVQDINRVTIFDGLDLFAGAPRVTLHDFDALTNLRLLQKLGKLKKVKIIGVPPTISETRAVREVAAKLSASQP